jgi:nucleoside-diphosphate-sugar epimerase
MTDAEFLDYWNAHIEATDEFIRSQKFVATEIPVGKPQVRYFEESDQWVPRGNVVRAVILTDAAVEPDLEEPFLSIDDRDFSVREFVKMVGTFGGWGIRISFVPDEQIHIKPKIKVREPEEKKKRSSKRRKAR